MGEADPPFALHARLRSNLCHPLCPPLTSTQRIANGFLVVEAGKCVSDRVEANCGPAAEVVPLAFDDADAKQQNVNGIPNYKRRFAQQVGDRLASETGAPFG